MTCSCVKTLFGDSAGEEDQSSSSTMSVLPKPSEVDADNIIKPKHDELSVDRRQAYEQYKKVHEEKKLEEFLGNFKKDRQGNITPIREIKFPPLQAEQVKPPMSTTFSPEKWS